MSFDPLDPAFIDNPYPAYARLRDEAPVSYLDAHDVWLVTRYSDVSRMLGDPATFSSKVGMSRDFGGSGTGVGYRIGAPKVRVLIATDPPEHQIFRRAVASVFSPAAVAVVRERVTQIARQQVGVLLRHNESGEADFCADVASPVPVLVLGELLGVPAELHDEFREWSTVIMSDLDQANSAVEGLGRGIDMFRFFSRQLRRREGFFDTLAKAREAGLTDHEMLAFCAFLLVAGIETTTNMVTNLLAALLANPHVQQRLREVPQLLAGVIEEGVRYDTSVQALWRGTTHDVELRGRTIPAGARVLAMFGAANRDERKFPDPDRFIVDRNPNEHLGFGGGPHYCLGTRLARVEIAAVLSELLAATRRVEPREGAVRTRSVVLRGFTRQPVRVMAK